MREAELKHGRLSMLAFLGWVAVDSGLRIPGLGYESIPSSFVAHDAAVANGSMGYESYENHQQPVLIVGHYMVHIILHELMCRYEIEIRLTIFFLPQIFAFCCYRARDNKWSCYIRPSKRVWSSIR